MKNYNYYEEVKEDVKNYINENIAFSDFDDLEELEQFLNEELWTVDSVTGNVSGSYTFNLFQAQDYVLENMDVLAEALEEFGTDSETIAEKFLSEDWEYFDVTIRCYVLGFCISDALDDIRNDFEAEKEVEKEEETENE